MRHYWQVYQEFFKTSLAKSTSFRINFLLLFILDITFYTASFAPIDFIFSYTSHIGVWNREQFMFFTSFILVVDHLHMTFLSGSFWMLAEDLKLGNLDFTLLRPIHSLFIVFFRYVRAHSFPSGIVLWCVLGYFASKAQLSLLSWILLPLMIGLGFILLALMEFLFSTLMFWITEGIGLNFLRMQIQHVARYPDFIYMTFTRKIFTFVFPILITASTPTHFLLDPSQWHQLAYLLGAIFIILVLLLKIWKVALNHYESASS